MPSKLTKHKIEAIAEAYCSNGFNKSKALIDNGYSVTYANSGRREAVYKNAQVKALIDAKRAENSSKAELTIAKVLKDLDTALAIALEQSNVAGMARISELQGKYLRMFGDNAGAAAGLTLNFSGEVAKPALRLTGTDPSDTD